MLKIIYTTDKNPWWKGKYTGYLTQHFSHGKQLSTLLSNKFKLLFDSLSSSISAEKNDCKIVISTG